MDDNVLQLAKKIYIGLMSDSHRPKGAELLAEEAFKFARVFYQVFEKEKQK
jgi:hypothetical protein